MLDNLGSEDDGFLSYSWGATPNWPEENSYDTEALCLEKTGTNPGDCIKHPDTPTGKWRYDPMLDSADCVDGEKIIICPAQVQLPFFGFVNVLAVLTILIFMYGYLIIRKK